MTDKEKIIEALECADKHICRHEDGTSRGGSIWTICDTCGATWADDRGGFKPSPWPEFFDQAMDALKEPEPEETTNNFNDFMATVTKVVETGLEAFNSAATKDKTTKTKYHDPKEINTMISFVESAAKYFANRDTKGEDSAHWSNVYNAKNCRVVINMLELYKSMVERQ